jgi:nitrogen regulatory protein PII
MQQQNMKLFHIITSVTLKERIRTILLKVGVPGYTFFSVGGEGDSGFQSGHFDADSNILFMVVVPLDKVEALQERLAKDVKKGYQHMVFSQDTQVHKPKAD